MRRMMRYNNWEFDPLSVIPLCPECNPRGNPWLAVASRGDLVQNSFVLPTDADYADQFGRAPMGATDSKITSYAMINNGGMGNVICGPTTDGQPVFNFDEAFPGERPLGCVNIFNFSWVFFNVAGQAPQQRSGDDGSDASRNTIIGVCVGVPIALLIAGVAVFQHRKKTGVDAYAPVNMANYE